MDNTVFSVSIIIPVFNVEKYLDECIESIVTSTIKPLEIIIVDDGSTDASGILAQGWAKRCELVTYLKTENMGVSNARNIGISKAKGEWIMFVDSDDYLTKESLADLAAVADSSVDIVLADYKYVYEGKTVTENFYNMEKGVLERDKIDLVNDILIGQKAIHANVGVPWSKLYKRKFLEENSFHFPVGLKRMQDSIFNLYTFGKAKSIYYLNKPVYCYRARYDSSVHRFSPDFGKTVDIILNEISLFFEEGVVPYDDRAEIIINTKKALLFIEWCRLVPAHPDCNWSTARKLKELRREKRILLGKKAILDNKSIAVKKLLIIHTFLLGWNMCGYLMIWAREQMIKMR